MSGVNTSDFIKKKGLTVRDLVTIGIFTAVYVVVFLVGGMVFAPNPVITFYMPIGCALVCGPIFLLLVARVPKHGPIIILGLLIGLLMFATGMHWMMNTAYIVLGIVADLVAGVGKFKSIKLNILAYIIFALPPVGSYVMFFLDKAVWAKSIMAGGTEQSYVDTMIASGPNWLLPVIIVGTIIAALLSGLLGRVLLKKQFEKAGITA